MRDPDAAARLHDGLERGDEPARRAKRADRAPVVLVTDRLTVRDDEDRTVVEARADVLLEPLLGPDALVPEPQQRFLLGRDAGARQRAGESRDFLRQRAEEARVGVGGRRDRVPGLEPFGPFGHPFHRLGDAPAHQEPRDAGQQQHQDAEPHGRALPEAPFAVLDVLRVEHDRYGADRVVVASERNDVNEREPPGDGVHRAHGLVLADGVRHLRGDAPEEWLHLRRRFDEAPELVVDRERPIGSREPLQQAIEAGPSLSYQQGLGRFADRFTDKRAPSLEILDQAGAVFTDLQIREADRDDQRRDPDRPEQPDEKSHRSGKWRATTVPLTVTLLSIVLTHRIS